MKLVLAVSLVLNVALAAVVGHNWQKQSHAVEKPVAIAPIIQIRNEYRPGSTVIEPGIVTNHFHWKMIESSNYENYVRNLRAVGCPEKTVHDIILAEIQKTYAVKCAAVPLAVTFWSCGPERHAAGRHRDEKQREIKAEAQALLRQLIGVDFIGESEDGSDDLIKNAFFRFFVGPLPEPVFEQVNLALEKIISSTSEMQDRSKGILLPSERQSLLDMREQCLASVRQQLSSAQYDEFTRRFAAARLLDHELNDFHVSAGELRAIAGIYAGIFGVSLDVLESFDNHDKEQTAAQKEIFDKRLHEFLGAARFADYQRENDLDFKNVKALTEQQSLAPEIALKIYEIKSLFDSQCRLLHQDVALSPSELSDQLRQTQDSTRSAIEQLLGGKTFGLYLSQHGGGWLTNDLRQ